MKTTRLLAAMALAAWLIPTPSPALVPVIDATAIAHAIEEINQMIQQYRILFCSFQTSQQTMLSLQHTNPSIMTVAPGLLDGQMRMPGSSAGAMPNLAFGTGTSAMGSQFYSQNHYYSPSGTDFAASEMQRQQIGIANIQGETQMGMQQAAQRIASLTQLEASIAGQPDVQAMAALNTRIASEKLYMANEGNRASYLQSMLATQQRVSDQRAQQNFRMQSDQWGATLQQSGQ